MMETTEHVEAQHGPAVTCSGLLCLFVGGARDGERIRVPLNPVIVLHDRCGSLDVRSVYHRETIAVEDYRWTIYRHESQNLVNTMQDILDGYRPNAKVSGGCPPSPTERTR